VAYNVHTDVFAGPFDLLLRLYHEQRVDLYEVALADIVDGFLAEVRSDAAARISKLPRVPGHRLNARRAEVPEALPDREEPDEESLALLEERDYLLARLSSARLSLPLERNSPSRSCRFQIMAPARPDLTSVSRVFSRTCSRAEP